MHNYYLISDDPATLFLISVIAVCVVGLLLLRACEVWLDIQNSRELGAYYSTIIQKLESRVEDLENQVWKK